MPFVNIIDDEVPVTETINHIPETNTRTETEKEKEGKERAPCWKHFKKIWVVENDGVKRKQGECKYCKACIKADTTRNGTTGLNKHAASCNENPVNKANKKQRTLQFQKVADGEGSVQTWKHDDTRIKKALLNLFVVAELPFKLVENEAFVEYTCALNGKYSLPSRTKLSKDISKYYIEERNRLIGYLSSPTNAIHLTTDTWTSSTQRVNYMVVIAHFIDEEWVMHKRIINFRPIHSHKGDEIGRELMECIRGWGIKNVMTMTLDNASSNDKAVDFLVRKLPNLYDNGKHFHIRCMAHVLNLIVKEGLSFQDYHVDCLKMAVRYIRNSTQRIERFKKLMKANGFESHRFLCGDCPTRWNSTYEMLKVACQLREIFFLYEIDDNSYSHELKRVPEHSDFGSCELMVEFLEKFKHKTELVSSSSNPLAHLFVREIFDVDFHLRKWGANKDFSVMATAMGKKYEKYWGKFDSLNDYMYFGVMLDPTMKKAFLEHAFKKMIEYTNTNSTPISKEMIGMKATTLVKDVEKRLEVLFKTYKAKLDKVDVHSSSQEASNNGGGTSHGGNDFLGGFLVDEESNSVAIETELKRYLTEPKIKLTVGFDILKWWKQNAVRFPIVSRMAKDILAIQVSTVASESAFSTGGRVLDAYRTNLSAPIVEALICTQDWVRKSRKPIVDDVEDILNDDDIAAEIEDAVNTQNSKGKRHIMTED